MKATTLLFAIIFMPISAFSQGAFVEHGLSYSADGKLLDGKYYISMNDNTQKVVTYYKGRLHGDYALYAADKRLLERGNFKFGQKHGDWITWSSSGTKKDEVSFSYGQRDGHWLIRDENGILMFEMYYNIGVKVGLWHQYNKSGDLLQEIDQTKSL